MKLTDMTHTESKAEAKGSEKNRARGPGAVVGGESPPSVYLSHEHMSKLGAKKPPKVGDKLHLEAIAHVESVSANRGEDGKPRHSVHLHLHHVGYEHHAETAQDKAANAHKGAKAAMDDALGDLATDDETE